MPTFVDVRLVVLEYLLNGPAWTTALKAACGNGERIWIGREVPEGYNVSQGPAVLLDARGGGEHYSGAMQNPSFQFMCYAEDDAGAVALAGLLYQALHKRRGTQIAYALREEGTRERLITEQDTGWPLALVFYLIRVRNP